MNKIIVTLSMLAMGMGSMVPAYAQTQENMKSNAKVNKESVKDYPANSWLKQSVAVVRILDKLESRVTLMQIPVGQSAQFKSLTITPQSCLVRPPSSPADSAAFLDIRDSKRTGFLFSAWILAAEPAASIFEHPLYNISLKGCAGLTEKEAVSAKPSILPPTSSPTLPLSSSSVKPKQSTEPAPDSSSLEQSLENTLQSQH